MKKSNNSVNSSVITNDKDGKFANNSITSSQQSQILMKKSSNIVQNKV